MEVLLRLFARLPLRVLHGFGTVLGWAVFALSASYRRHFLTNAEGAGLTRRDRVRAIGSAGRMIMELPWVWFAPIERKTAAIRWDGRELIEAALARGRGVVYLTPHLGCFEILPLAHAHWLAPRHGPLAVLFRTPRTVWLGHLVARTRAQPGVTALPAGTAGVRSLYRALREGKAVGFLPDQVPEAGLGEWSTFFRRPAYTMHLAIRLARRTGAKLLLIHGQRLSAGSGFRVCVRDCSIDFDQTDKECVDAMNRAVEALIREAPDDYLWGYARYKQPRMLQVPYAGSADE